MALLRHILWGMAGLALGSLLVEGMLRLGEAGPWWRAVPLAEASFYGPDPVAGYAHRPDAEGVWLTEHRARQQVSPQGLLDRPYGETPPSGTQRVAVLGDSVVEALQVERPQTFQRLAEGLLAPETGPAEVMNLGIAGATPAVIAARLETHALPYHPDAVVILLSMGDFRTGGTGFSSPITTYEEGSNGTVRRGIAFRDSRGYRFRTGPGGDVFYFLLDHLRLARAVNARVNAGIFNELTVTKTTREPPSSECEDLAPHFAVWRDGADTFAAQRVTAFVDDIAVQLRGKDIALVIAMQGLGEPCARTAMDRTKLQALVQRRFAEKLPGTRIMDWEAAIAQRLPPGKTLLDLRGFGAAQGRGHLNEDGHRTYAETLAAVLTPVLAERK
jgi:hypothetical protein